jgi:hypothetical protein
VKLTLAIGVALILSSAAYGQTGSDPEHVIKRMFDTASYEGHDQKVIGRLGDVGAVLVTKILAGRDLTQQTIDTALVVIEGSFADPNFVEAASDRQPRTALLLLRYLGLSTSDPVVKKRIADTVKYVQDRYAASPQGARQ